MLSWIRKQVGQFAYGQLAFAVRAVLSPNVLGATALIVDRDGKVLLARHSYASGLSLPGGGVKRGEPPIEAVMRELREELGVIRADPPEFIGIFTRRAGWVTNVVVLYRLSNAEVEFRRNFEVREIFFVDPLAPPPMTTPGTRRRLAEFTGRAPQSPYW
ncbi:MAG TPA: NUDIX domain-containing protein [Rhizomicrobium sp.]